MPNITLSIPEETMDKMRKHSHIKWSKAIRSIIEQKLDKLEESEALARKSRLKMHDFGPVGARIKASAAKHVKRLLNESYS